MSANSFELIAEERHDFGTNASRRLRREGKTPAIVYGAGKDNTNVLLDHNKLIHSLDVEAFHNAIIEVKTASGVEPVILREVHMHPHKPQVLHVDFLRVNMSEKLSTSVPIHVVGEEDAPGIKMEDGMLSRLINDIDIQCLPKDLPEYVEIDVSELALGETLHLSDIKLPDGVEIPALAADTDENDLGVITISAQRTVEEEVEEEVVEGEDGDATEAEASDDKEEKEDS